MGPAAHICGSTAPPGLPDEWPDDAPDELRFCCYGAAMGGPRDCTCWRPVYDQEQAETLQLDANHEIGTTRCHDCAYRSDSPERGDDSDAEELEGIVYSGQPFFCHQGMRRVVAWRHPGAGVTIDAPEGDYDPPGAEGRVYKADGSPADVCAGWSNKRLAVLRERAEILSA